MSLDLMLLLKSLLRHLRLCERRQVLVGLGGVRQFERLDRLHSFRFIKVLLVLF